MDLAEFLVGVCPVVPHHQIGNDRRVLCLDAEDIVALDADAVANLNHEEWDGVFFLQLAHVGDGDRRRCDRHLTPKEDGECRRRAPHGDITDLTEGIPLHIRYRISGGRRTCSRCVVRGCRVIRRRIIAASTAQEGVYLLL